MFGMPLPCHAERSVSAVKHPHTRFLATARNDREKVLGMTKKMLGTTQKAHALTSLVMLNEASAQ